MLIFQFATQENFSEGNHKSGADDGEDRFCPSQFFGESLKPTGFQAMGDPMAAMAPSRLKWSDLDYFGGTLWLCQRMGGCWEDVGRMLGGWVRTERLMLPSGYVKIIENGHRNSSFTY